MIMTFVLPLAFTTGLLPALPRSRHRVVTSAVDPPPPELDDRTAQFMKRQGFKWNAKSRSWVKGDPARAQRLECRSSARVLRWEGDQAALPEQSIVTIRQATDRFEETLREAREEAIGSSETDRKIALEIKDRVAKPYAPFVWLAVQISIAAFLLATASVGQDAGGGASGLSSSFGDAAAAAATAAASPGLTAFESDFLLPAAIGLACAPLLSTLRRERWVRQPGIEDSDGAIERLLVDAQLGSYALPAPWEWRASDRAWGAAAFASESVATVNMALFWHAGVQQAVVGATSNAVGEVGAVALGILALAGASAARAAYFYDEVVDGIPAELEASKRLASRAESYYGMTATNAEAAALSMETTRALAQGWVRKFERGEKAKVDQLLLAFASSAMCAIVYELGGRSVVGPALAVAFSAVDTYVFRPDTELTRVTIQLDALQTAALD